METGYQPLRILKCRANILLNNTDRSQTQTVCKKISQTRAYIALSFRFPFPAQVRRALESEARIKEKVSFEHVVPLLPKINSAARSFERISEGRLLVR
jgi:hypothetical protein